MAAVASCPPLTRESVQNAHKKINSWIHKTPIITCTTIDDLASTPQSQRCPSTGPNKASEPAPHGDTASDASTYTATPKVRLFFKCENQQKIGAFKARGAFHALSRLIDEEGLDVIRKRGVVTHSSGTIATISNRTRLTCTRQSCTSIGIGS